jgi:uncharacterized caspase-like protein
MWKAVIAGPVALLILGGSLSSGQSVRGQTDRRDLTAPSSPAGSRKQVTSAATTSQAPVPGKGTAHPVALVIGNAAYPDAESPLSAPVNNARALAEALRERGFDVVFGENLTKSEMHQAIETFTDKVTPGSVALIFFSGFGIQANRKTYLIPVNAQIWIENDVRRDGVSVEPILGDVETKGAAVKLVILDAARRNPYERRFRGFAAGLADIYAPDETLMMYSASPGKVVNDSEGDESVLLSELIAQIRRPGQTAEQVFNHTRLAVSQSSKRKQVPWVSSSLAEDFSFESAKPASTAPGVR